MTIRTFFACSAMLCISLMPFVAKAQGVVTVHPKVQRFIGEVSALDRDKYTTAHLLFNNTDADFEAFKSDYNINPDYIGSRQFWNPFFKVRDGVIPNVGNKYSGVRNVQPGLVATGRASSLFYDDSKDYSVEDVSEFSKNAAAYVAESYRKDWALVPEYIEPFNEPMVHATDYYPEGRGTPKQYISSKIDAVITRICTFHRDLGQAIHNTPELANMKVTGFASAYPEVENNDFDLWRSRFKKFIDIAGADIDVFSVHLYDGKGINNSGGRRSGSNSEAIIDLIEAYSFIKLGVVKPVAVTEYGRLVLDQPGSPNVPNYEPVENSQAVRSQLHLLMNFMERAGTLANAIPFSVSKPDTPEAKFSKAGLWTKNAAGNWELTPRKYFFEMLKDLKGDRVLIQSNNIDVQTQAFVSGKQLFVVLNNLNDEPQTVQLNVADTENLLEVEVKQLKIFLDKVPELTLNTSSTAPEELRLEYGETAVLTYTFSEDITFDNTIQSTKYYATEYLKPIQANTNNTFTFDTVRTGHGFATLRLGVGRAHGKSLRPTIKINGTPVTFNEDVIRGYDQHNRTQFFGILEIPVSMALLQTGTNTLEVSFPDNGGHISSAILQVQTATQPLDVVSGLTSSLPVYELALFPNPVQRGTSVQLPEAMPDMSYQVCNAAGVPLFQLNQRIINTRSLTPGLYIIRGSNQEAVWVSRLIVH